MKVYYSYIAGLFDGEGTACIYLRKTKKPHYRIIPFMRIEVKRRKAEIVLEYCKLRRRKIKKKYNARIGDEEYNLVKLFKLVKEGVYN